MDYNIVVTVNQFQDKVIKARAKMKEISAQQVVSDLVNEKVTEHADAMIADALNTKLSKMTSGMALAKLDAMDEG